MTCRKYRDDDFISILAWYEARLIRPVKGLLSPIGSIVPGIAAGFLMTTNTTACIFEPFIANPRANKHDRSEALNLIITDLVEQARSMGFDRVFGFSSNESMIEHGLRHGFVVVEESTTICKELK